MYNQLIILKLTLVQHVGSIRHLLFVEEQCHPVPGSTPLRLQTWGLDPRGHASPQMRITSLLQGMMTCLCDCHLILFIIYIVIMIK